MESRPMTLSGTVPSMFGPEIFSLAGVLILSSLFFILKQFDRTPFPLVNKKKIFEIGYSKTKKRWIHHARDLIDFGLSKSSVFRSNTDNGVKIILDPKYATEIRNHPALTFGTAFGNDFHSYIKGFEPFREVTAPDQIFQYAVQTKLTQSLGHLMEPLSAETTIVLEQHWTNKTDWHETDLQKTVLDMVSQLSSRIFLGKKICRNPDWLRITPDFTIHSILAAEDLRRWPRLLRPFVANFLPSVHKIRAELQEANAIMTPILEERRRAKEAQIKEGKTPERYADAIQWMEDTAKGRPYNPAASQLAMSIAAIHTTTDMLCKVLLDLCGRDKLIEELRQEIITVIKEEGWKKSTLHNLKLMDSVLKESSRLQPLSVASMRRLALEDVKLSDGTLIKKGSDLLVSGARMWDPNFYPNPEVFDPYRFLKLREVPGHETSAQLVAPSPQHFGFGYGNHACPGRFFAANEIKIALCHMLLKYDISLPEGYTPPPRTNGMSFNVDPRARLLVKRRQEEIPL